MKVIHHFAHDKHHIELRPWTWYLLKGLEGDDNKLQYIDREPRYKGNTKYYVAKFRYRTSKEYKNSAPFLIGIKVAEPQVPLASPIPSASQVPPTSPVLLVPPVRPTL